MTSSSVESSSPMVTESYEEQVATENIVSLSYPSAEDKERKVFMNDINKFMSEIGKPLSKIPIMGYKELDLYQLFKEVTAYGGFNEVVKNVGTWSKIWKRLGNFDPSITDSSFRLKKNYERYLLEYEYKCFPDHKQQAVELEKQMQLKKSQQQQMYQQQQTVLNSSEVAGTLSVPTVSMTSTSPQQSSPRPLSRSTDGKIERPKKANSGSRNGAKRSSKSNNMKDLAREKSGAIKLPLVLGELTLENLGVIIPRPPYISEKHIWPVGFSSSRYFSSMLNPELRVKYTSQIVDAGDRPQFVVTAADDSSNPIISHSPSGAWRAVLKRIMAKNNNNPSNNSSSDDGINKKNNNNISVSGTLRFGLAHPVVSHLIRELPNADKCQDVILLNSSSANMMTQYFNQVGSDSNNSSPLSSPPSSPTMSPIASPVSSPLSSPWQLRKRKANMNYNDFYSTSESDEEYNNSATTSPRVKHTRSSAMNNQYDVVMEDNSEHFSARDVSFTTREEMDALESAVATLQALKYCTVY